MPAKFKKIAEKASRAFNAKICGVDIIIEDFEKDEYSIIEINDNPGYPTPNSFRFILFKKCTHNTTIQPG